MRLTGLRTGRGRSRDADDPADRGVGEMVGGIGALMSGRILVAAMGWAGTVLIVRSLSLHSWGQLSFVLSFLALISIIGDLANSPAVIRGVLHDADPGRFAGSYVLLRWVLGVLCYAVAVAFVVLAGYPSPVVQATAVAGVVVVLTSVSDGYDAVFQAMVRMGPAAVASVLGQAAQLALIVVLALLGSSMVVFTVPFVLAQVVIVAWKLHIVRRIVVFRYTVMWSRWVSLVRVALPLAVGSGLMILYYNLDSVMLSKIGTFSAVGIYGVAYKFAGVVNFLAGALMTSLLGLLARYWPEEPSQFWRAFGRAWVLMSVSAVLIVVEFGLFAPQAIRLLFGATFVEGAGAARIIVASECLGLFSALAITVLMAVARNRRYVLAGLAGLVVNFSLNLVLIPRYSYRGAAWATLVTEVIVVVVMWSAVLRMAGRPRLPMRPAVKAAACGAVVAGAAWLALRVTPWPIVAVGSTLVYLALLHLWKVPGVAGLRSLLRNDDLPGPDPPARGSPAHGT